MPGRLTVLVVRGREVRASLSWEMRREIGPAHRCCRVIELSSYPTLTLPEISQVTMLPPIMPRSFNRTMSDENVVEWIAVLHADVPLARVQMRCSARNAAALRDMGDRIWA